MYDDTMSTIPQTKQLEETVMLSFRVSEDERRQIKSRAALAGKSVQDFCRETILSKLKAKAA